MEMCVTQYANADSAMGVQLEEDKSVLQTPQIQSRQLITQQPCWRLSGDLEANPTHVFCSCTELKPLNKRHYGICHYTQLCCDAPKEQEKAIQDFLKIFWMVALTTLGM